MTHKDIINLWPSLRDFANDIGVAYGTAKAMRRRGSIPAKYWAAMIDHASTRKISGVTHKKLAVSLVSFSKQDKAA